MAAITRQTSLTSSIASLRSGAPCSAGQASCDSVSRICSSAKMDRLSGIRAAVSMMWKKVEFDPRIHHAAGGDHRNQPVGVPLSSIAPCG